MDRSKILIAVLASASAVLAVGCAHAPVNNVSPDEAARINRKLVRNAVSFGPGAEVGAVVPDVSAPCLRAEVVPETVSSNRLVEKHREWVLDCDVRLLGIPERPGAGERK